MVGKIVLGALLVGVACAAWAVREGVLAIPERWNPWTPLDFNAPPGPLTRYKLSRLSRDPDSCRQVLATTAIEYEALSDRRTAEGCGFTGALRIDATPTRVNESFSLTCPAAVSLALWERNVLQPAALRHFNQPVARIEHFGSYSCRNVYGRASGRRSEHATANAFDVAGFVLADGERIRVVNDWSDERTGAFLREVRDGACRYFDGVLSPDYNAAHRDHFHLDRGPYRVCR
jgi:hypothetical protein